MSFETWVTNPAGGSTSLGSPFRRFAFSRVLNEPGVGSLEYHLDNQTVREQPNLFAEGNVVWMRYRGQTFAWLVEQRQVVLDEGEHASDWVKVSGRGVLQLLGDRIALPPAFDEGANLDPSTWGKDNQWRRFVNRPAGEMLWDLIDETNAFIVARGGTAIVRGTVETTGSDGWTQDLRFDNLLEVVDAVTSAYGDVYMDGLTFNYYNAQGVDRSSSVIVEEGADLTKLERTVSDRDTVSWLVGEGLGEGVFAKLAVAEDSTIARPRMAYLDAKDANNLPLLQVLTGAALTENRPFESTGFEFVETRYEAFTHFDVGDTIRAIASSRNVDAAARVVGIVVAEQDDDTVRVGCDLTSPRPDQIVGLDERQRSTARSLGVRNRQPQGALVPIPFSGADVFDSTDTMDVFLKLTDRAYVMVEVTCTLRFREFFAAAKSAVSSGSLTSDSGGGSTSGASSASTSGGESGHFHTWAVWISNTAGSFTKRLYRRLVDFNLETETAADIETSSGTSHDHGIPHTHSTPNHTHSVPGHTHSLVFGVQKETFPASHSVTVRVYERNGGSWTLRSTVTGLTDDIEDLDLTATIDGPGDWRLELQSEAAQPNSGRLGCDVYGLVWAAVKSA